MEDMMQGIYSIITISFASRARVGVIEGGHVSRCLQLAFFVGYWGSLVRVDG